MPYLNQEKKRELAPLIKSICKKHGIKATLSVTSNRSTLDLNIKSGSIDFDGRQRSISSSYHKADFADNEKALIVPGVFPSVEALPDPAVALNVIEHLNQPPPPKPSPIVST